MFFSTSSAQLHTTTVGGPRKDVLHTPSFSAPFSVLGMRRLLQISQSLQRPSSRPHGRHVPMSFVRLRDQTPSSLHDSHDRSTWQRDLSMRGSRHARLQPSLSASTRLGASSAQRPRHRHGIQTTSLRPGKRCVEGKVVRASANGTVGYVAEEAGCRQGCNGYVASGSGNGGHQA